jgi:16S rRNA (guanine966-N2)-methyltransferase
MRIIAGQLRGRRLLAPDDESIRPTSDRVREALFNILAHGKFTADGASPIPGAVVLDAFCGTGALGFEALSRGAARAIFADKDEKALALVRANARALGVESQVLIVRGDLRHPPKAPAAASLAFLDPPYGESLAETALAELAAMGWLAPGALITVELARREAFAAPAGFTELERRDYGKTRIAILRHADGVTPGHSGDSAFNSCKRQRR